MISLPRPLRFATHCPLELTVLSAALVLSACASSATPGASAAQPLAATPASAPAGAGVPSKGSPGVEADCRAWATRIDGPYRYENNLWGSDKAKGKFEQCLLTRNVNGRSQVGWSWNWPGFDPTVFAYPEIIFGWKPWSGGKPTDARFPLRVSDVRHLTLSYEVETQATGSFNLAPEIWLTSSGAWSERANSQLITTEVMFWMDYAEGARPAGKVVQTPTLDGVTYELWKEDNIGAQANGKGWALLSFKSPTIQHKATISIHSLLKHLVESKLVNASDYVASVEFGNEVMGGSGTTWVEHFEVDLQQ